MAVGKVDRQRLILWLESFEQEVTEERQRHQLVLQALHDVEAENRSLREELGGFCITPRKGLIQISRRRSALGRGHAEGPRIGNTSRKGNL
jgi:hypothetical protein